MTVTVKVIAYTAFFSLTGLLIMRNFISKAKPTIAIIISTVT